ADVEEPFAPDRRLNQYVHEKSTGDGRAGLYQLFERPEWDDGEVSDRQGLEIVVRNPQKERLKVKRIAGHLDRDDLAPAVGRELVPIGKSRNEQRAGIGVLAFAKNILTRAKTPRRVRKEAQGLLIVGRQQAVAQQLADEQVQPFVSRGRAICPNG